MVKIHVWHTLDDGRIIAVGRLAATANLKAIPIAKDNQGAFETHIDESAITTLHQTHRVDVVKNKLVLASPKGVD